MPKILWLVSITLPQAAAAVGLASDQVGGGWLAGMLDALAPQLRLTVFSGTPLRMRDWAVMMRHSMT